jgi:hypothetical protein
MHKLKLELDLLAVESFETLRTGAPRGTVEAFVPTVRLCNTDEPSCGGTCYSCDYNSCVGSCDASCATCEATCGYTCDDASCGTCLTNCGQESCVYVCP